LSCPRTAVDDQGFLRIAAELQKHLGETCHELRRDTLEAIRRLPEHELLFPWPYAKRQIWLRYERDILGPAGLLQRGDFPDYRNLKFHKLRRTSASHLAAVAGEYAAMQHLGHGNIETTRKSYLDPSIALPRESAAKILPALAVSSTNDVPSNGRTNA